MPRIAKHMPRDPAGETRKSALAAKLKELRGKRRALDTQIRHLEKLWANKRPWYHCKRCGHEWRGIHFNVTPTHCSRCHSAGWNREAKRKRARKPTDSPHPGWETRKVKKPKTVTMVPVPEHRIDPLLDTVDPITNLDIRESLRASLFLPTGLPPPPSVESYSQPLLIPKSPVITEMEQALHAYFPPPPSLTVPEPQLYRPRLVEEPQPESIAQEQVNVHNGYADAPKEPEPDWEAILPKVSLEFDEDAARGEEAWLAGD